ncbi:hypothetical protein LR48_Vigan03g277700 [Vigna angularis]|uniref:Pectinesterase inhibitor domain-containing protein n=2 Tax=Phaseolus angularis TaxID=3914 RepID=A0A0L9U956_PHAAN|nr:uncharacterized protein LOC108327628 [Vigna angularis]KAG2406521.1 uncharacterized protein HKW66_Vig0057770 [Vigna angularis]KOM39395.1 hypothetical protein LR48_Vigan03g277700 [Vigna angularis]BAT86247.1 hypothetical protein VIGAN_04388100 [Vigna angularis var. angularis]
MGSIKNLLITIVSLTSLLQSTTHAFVQAPSPSPSASQSLLVNPNNILGAASNTVDNLFKPSLHILDFCQGTENPALCAETIAPSLEGTFDPIKALETEMEATFVQSKKVAKIISEALRNPNTDPRARGALEICKSQYKSIMETVNDAVELLNQQNVVDAYYKFSSVISDQATCEDAFVESPGVTIPFSDESHTVYQLGGNCLAVMDGMVNNRNRFLLV